MYKLTVFNVTPIMYFLNFTSFFLLSVGLIGGAALGYGASRMMGGGPFGGFGMGRMGSWSSMSSFGSHGSFGSCGSFGSFD